MTQTQNYTMEFVIIKNLPSYMYWNSLEQWIENQSVVEVVIIENPCSSTGESEWKPVSYEVRLIYPVQDQDTLIEQSP